MVLFSLLNSPYQVMSKIAQLKDKKLSKPFFVLLPNLLLELQKTLLITTEDSVEPLVPSHLLVLEEDSKTQQTQPMPLTLLLFQPPVKFKLMSNLLLLLPPPKLLPN